VETNGDKKLIPVYTHFNQFQQLKVVQFGGGEGKEQGG
jgi:hypothetical protein